MNCAAEGALFILAVYETHFTDMPATAGDFNADYGAVIEYIYPVVTVVTFVLVVQDSSPLLSIFQVNPNIALD